MSSSQNFNIRNDSIDILRGIAIILVVLGHLNPGDLLTKFIYTSHLFLFFFISGYLSKITPLGKTHVFLRRKALRLLVPFFFWNGFSIGIYMLIENKLSFQSAIEQFFFLNGSVGWNSPVWFLLVLFEVELLWYLICRNKWLVIITFFVSTGGFIALSYFSFIAPFGFHLVPVGLMFYCFGALYRKFNSRVSFGNLVTVGILLFFLIINVISGVIFNDKISVYHCIFNNVYLTTLAGISGVLFYYHLSCLLGKLNFLKRILSPFGIHSMLIVSTHYYFLWLLSFISQKLDWIDLWHYSSFVKGTLICVGMMILYYVSFKLYDKVVKRLPWIKYFV